MDISMPSTSFAGQKMRGGFTLIELLVVIAIIGILSAIVLSSLSNARKLSFDAKVKEQISNIRNAAQIYQINTGNYGTTTVDCTLGMFGDAPSGMQKLAVSGNYPVGENNIICISNGTNYAVEDNLSVAGNYWCSDSNAVSKQVTTLISTTTPGTYLCPP